MFQGIRADVNLLDKYNDQETPLNIKKQRDGLDEIKAASNKMDEQSKTTGDLSVKNLPTDSLDVASGEAKVQKNKQFRKEGREDQ